MDGFSILFLGFITSFLVVLFATPSLIKVAKLKHLVDEPSESRKMHRWSIPTIGGIVVFGAIIFSYSIWFPEEYEHISNIYSNFKYLIACLILLFFVGVKDDIIGTAPIKKLIAHGIVGFILIIMADIRIIEMHDLFGVQNELDLWQSYFLTFFIYIVIVNSINLIDGLDGLASGIGFISAVVFGFMFYISGNVPLALLGFVLAGALLGFLIFNFSPARIFMGDSGSLLVGVILCVLAINMINEDYHSSPQWLQTLNKPVFAMSILVYPLVDTLRIFTVRALKGRSPFYADKNHIHHNLKDLGMGHSMSVSLICLFNLVIIGLQFLFQIHLGVKDQTLLFFLQLTCSFSFVAVVFLVKRNKKVKSLKG